jgi:hypothetical protein
MPVVARLDSGKPLGQIARVRSNPLCQCRDELAENPESEQLQWQGLLRSSSTFLSSSLAILETLESRKNSQILTEISKRIIFQEFILMQV